jgi:diguanylate cyclase
MVELLCTLTGIIAGVAIVASIVHQHGERQKFAADSGAADPDRIFGIADQLQVISHRVAADVSAHSEKVVHISDRLGMPAPDSEQVISTIHEFINANQAMQGQLADAQKQIAQQSRMIEQASLQARTDALTGLANRRALNEFLANSIEVVGEVPITGLLLMDIDHFKSFNDNFGHATGDAVLASFARSMATCCGQSSFAARYGGEEFSVVLSANSVDELVQKATEVRYFVSEQVISYEDLQLKITASGGLCILLPGDSCSAVYERADEGLYQAKKAGRNRGFWLSENGWLPFPIRSGTPQLLAELGVTDTPVAAVQPERPIDAPNLVKPISRLEAQATVQTAVAAKSPLTSETQPAKTAEQPVVAETPGPEVDFEMAEVLDLNAFVSRLEAFLEQLRKAELPAAAFMVEAIGMRRFDSNAANQCWSEIVETVQRNLRGIDVPCLYRPFTLCVFMPGCSLDAGVARAAKIKSALRDAAKTWNTNALPEKFAISAASVVGSEDNARFLNRLELALDEAQDATDRELVVHDGNTCHFQEA